jgi:hypothetical protein
MDQIPLGAMLAFLKTGLPRPQRLVDLLSFEEAL